MSAHLVSDMFTRIRNAKLANNKIVTITSTKLTRGIASVLLSEGILDDFEETNIREKKKDIILSIKYKGKKHRISSFQDIQCISKPGSRKYCQSKNIPKIMGGLATTIISTSKGIITGNVAKKENLGGELLGYFF